MSRGMGSWFSRGKLEAAEGRQEVVKPPLLETPWRTFEKGENWEETYETKLKRDVRVVKCQNINRARILIFGPASSGKSSFINSVAAIDYGHIAAVVDAGSCGTSLTIMMNQFWPKHFATNFSLIDTMGIAASDAAGIHIDDTKALMEGQIEVAFKFNPASPSPVKPNHEPTLEEMGHCTVIMIDAQAYGKGSIPDNLLKKFKDLEEHAKQTNQRKVMVLTKIDLACDEIGKDIRNVYKSRKIKEIVNKASKDFGVPEMNIFPVQNYSKETEVDTNINILILLALRQMVRFSQHRTDNMMDQRQQPNETTATVDNSDN